MRLDLYPDTRLKAVRRGSGQVRTASMEDMNALVECHKKRNTFLERFSVQDHCMVATMGGNIIGYEWFSVNTFHIENNFQYKIHIPLDTVYAYDAYILPEYRLTGLWLKFKAHLFDIMRTLGRQKVIAFVEGGNRLSINTHLRFGFKPYKKVFILKIHNIRLVREKEIP